MELKKLEVPTTSITEVKKSPMDVFQQARDAQTAVYVFNREKIAGVMLTQEQYEQLLEELVELRQGQSTMAEPLIEIGTTNRLTPDFIEKIRATISVGTSLTAKQLDERMVTLGFITKKTGFGGVTELMNELQSRGKIVYQLRKKNQAASIYVELIGELDQQSSLLDRVVIKKILVREIN